MRTIGAISDTHGLLRPHVLAALAGCDPIIHAGDVGSSDVLARLGALAPVHAVRGNVDHGAWSANLPVTQRIEIDGFRIYVLHILAELDPQAADNVDAVIYGHSHRPKIETKNGTLLHAVERLQVELLGGLGRDELHRRALHRLGDGLRIAEVVLLSLRIRAHVLRGHKPSIVPKRPQLAAKMVRPDASLHAD